MNLPKQEPLSVIIDKINNHKILLPDFQRRFTWTSEEMQKQFIASVLSKMPLGSILLLEAQADEYAYKELGSKERSTKSLKGEVELLLDGQQRITVLANVFSNSIFRIVEQASNLISQNLKRRFFIKIPKYEKIQPENDLFNAKSLKFPIRGKEDPTFLTADIIDSIHVENFYVGKATPFNPYSKVKLPELVDRCGNCENGYFLIPLFLLIEENKGTIKNETCLKNILKEIANSMRRHIIDGFDESENKEKYVQEALLDEYYDYVSENKKDDKIEFEDILQKQSDDWVDKFATYLKSCVDDISLSQIVVDKTQRDRAIDIYENLNRGGVSLSIFDLIMARVAKSYRGDFYQRIVNNMKSEKTYDKDLIAEQSVKNAFINISKDIRYNATIKTNCLSDNDDISQLYIEAFLNVLAFVDNKNSSFNVELTKRQKKLSLEAKFIDENTDKVCTAIDRAMFFFQTRCGIRNISEINYRLMISVVSYIFFDDNNFENKDIHNLLEAWYWSSIFSGYFDSDQNSRMIEHIEKLNTSIKSIHTGIVDIAWIKNLNQDVLNAKYFSDKKFWLFNDVQNTERIPKKFLRDTVCQYYLSKTYPDLFDSNETLSVFSNKSHSLEKHHIIPLGSVKSYGESTNKLRNDEYNFLNSPLNFVYITKESNLAISSKSLHDYQQSINSRSYSALQFTQFDSTISNEDIIKILETRFISLQGDIQNNVNKLLPV